MEWEDIINKIEIMDKIFPNQPTEIDDGNKEYKWKIFPTRDEFLEDSMRIEERRNLELKCNKLASQMKYRIYEGNGNAVYILGVMDDGTSLGIGKYEMFKTLLFIIHASHIIEADINKIRLYKGIKGTVATVRISKIIKEYQTI